MEVERRKRREDFIVKIRVTIDFVYATDAQCQLWVIRYLFCCRSVVDLIPFVSVCNGVISAFVPRLQPMNSIKI